MNRLTHPFIAELKRFVANQNSTMGPIVMSLSQMVEPRKEYSPVGADIKLKQKKLSEIADMIHAAHVFHRSVRDDSGNNIDKLNSKRLHQDNVMSLLVGDYLLAQSSVDLADLRFPRIVGYIAKGLEDYTRGEFLKLQLLDNKDHGGSEDLYKNIERHAELTCGSLLSSACLSTALLAGYDDGLKLSPGSISDTLYTIGFHTGTAHRLIELLFHKQTNSEEEKTLVHSLDKQAFKNSILSHIDKSIHLVNKLNDNSFEVMKILQKMKEKCTNNDST